MENKFQPLKHIIINRLGLLSLILLVCVTGIAQNIEFVNSIYNFGTADENNRVDQTVKVYNPTSHGIQVSGVECFSLYDTEAFLVLDTSFYLFPGDTAAITVGFLPVHNVAYDLPLIVRTSTGFGHISTRLKGQGQYSKAYYQNTQDKSGTALRTALKAIISSGYNSLGYTSARDNMYATIDNVNGNVECVYTGRTASFSTRAGANANSFNCEHTFPQGFFSQNEPMRSDIHHLFPTDVSANSQRGNDPFGPVTNPSWSQGGSKSGGGKFEPRDVQKGASARGLMYFVVRYQDYTSFFQGHQNQMYNWHMTYPPSSAEIKRNNDIFSLQNNRNPFVDYPQFMDRMKALVGSADLDPEYDFYYSDDTIQLARANTGISTYSFLVYNHGDIPIKLFNWNLSDPTISFSPFLNDTVSLSSGDLMEIQLNFDASISYQNALLSFSNNYQGVTNFQVPINSEADFNQSEIHALDFEVYPNPADEYFMVKSGDSNLEGLMLTDILGRKFPLKIRGGEKINISDIPAGFYFLISEGGRAPVKIKIL